MWITVEKQAEKKLHWKMPVHCDPNQCTSDVAKFIITYCTVQQNNILSGWISGVCLTEKKN